MNLETFLGGLAQGDDAVWCDFLDRYGRLIHAVVRRFPFSEPEAEDVYQDACIAIYRSISSLRDPERLTAWIYGVTYRLAVDRVRRLRRRGQNAGSEVPLDPETLRGSAPDPEARLAGLQEAAYVRDLVDRLGPRCRDLVYALYLEDPPLSYREISERDGIPLGSIGPSRARCLKKLQEMLENASKPASESTSEQSVEVPDDREGRWT